MTRQQAIRLGSFLILATGAALLADEYKSGIQWTEPKVIQPGTKRRSAVGCSGPL